MASGFVTKKYFLSSSVWWKAGKLIPSPKIPQRTRTPAIKKNPMQVLAMESLFNEQ
jgi:hypothetical protein